MLVRTCILAILLALASPSGAQQLTPLFETNTFDQWTRVGEADFRLEDGVLIGEGSLARNSFLVSPRTYGDFVLESDVWISDGGNSGIQIRSRVADDSLVGYQIEIDPSPRAWSGGLYDERRRGWLDPLDGRDEARSAFRPGQWNRYRIECVGPRIRSWVNGVPCADYLDAMDIEGHIAFQVHSGPGMTVKWRDPRIAVLGRHAWRPIFDARSLDGWLAEGAGQWSVHDGAIVGRSDDARATLLTLGAQRDFTLRLRFRAIEGEGRIGFSQTDESDGAPRTEVILAAAPDALTGCLADAVKAGRVDPARFVSPARPGDWNDLTICAHDGRVSIHVNARRTDDARAETPAKPGPIRLIVREHSHLEFKDIALLVPD